MNNNHQQKKGGHFFNGFLWGAAIGGGLAYLLSTKKGRDLLKNLAQDSLDMLDDLTAEPETEEELSPIIDEDAIQENVQEDTTSSENQSSDGKKSEVTTKKRFFKAKRK